MSHLEPALRKALAIQSAYYRCIAYDKGPGILQNERIGFHPRQLSWIGIQITLAAEDSSLIIRAAPPTHEDGAERNTGCRGQRLRVDKADLLHDIVRKRFRTAIQRDQRLRPVLSHSADDLIQHVAHGALLMPLVTFVPSVPRLKSFPVRVPGIFAVPGSFRVMTKAERVFSAAVKCMKLNAEDIQE